MLDLNHPQTRWIMAASRDSDAVLTFAELMTLLPRVTRPIERLRQLNRDHFDATSVIVGQAFFSRDTGWNLP